MENIYHRYVRVPFEIVRPDFSYEYPDESKHVVISASDYNASELVKFLGGFGISITDMESFYTRPNGGELPIHTDMPVIDNRVKLNMTWGPEEGTTRWWKAKDQKTLQRNFVQKYSDLEFTDAEHDNLLIKKSDADLVYEASTNRPSLVNVGQLHSTYNPSDQGRWTICFILGNAETGTYLDWKTAVKKFGYYLE
jgi:hypothetical protein